MEGFLANNRDTLTRIRRLQRAPLSGAAHLNIILPELLRRLGDTGLSISTHDAYTTSWTRNQLGVEKTHVNDALCLGRPGNVVVPDIKLVVQATGHGDRQMLRPPDRHGNPRGQGYRDYCALSRQQQGYTRCPGHRAHARRIASIASGDLVRFGHSKYGTLTGYAALDKKKNRVGVTHDGRIVSVKAEAATLVARSTGYRASAAENAA